MSSEVTRWEQPQRPAVWWTPEGKHQRAVAYVDRKVDFLTRVEMAKAEVQVAQVNAKAMVAASVMEAGCRLVDYGRFLAQDDPMKQAICSTVTSDFVTDQRRGLFSGWTSRY